MAETEDIDCEVITISEMQVVGQHWIIIEAIGSGAYEDVFHVWNKENGNQGAMKIECLRTTDRILKLEVIELEVLKPYKRKRSSAAG